MDGSGPALRACRNRGDPDIAAAAAAAAAELSEALVLDGELVVPHRGVAAFGELQRRLVLGYGWARPSQRGAWFLTAAVGVSE
ncbi:hypothetical protein ACFVTY_33395 [Streptomyces sp. NPDC058067]|uniref:hypothetical protein n=1 Tax=Streptomyces sp. NPDC058067 TaxID=3346324 RepID=UPI0036E0D401